MFINQGVIPSRKIKKTAYAEGLHSALTLVPLNLLPCAVQIMECVMKLLANLAAAKPRTKVSRSVDRTNSVAKEPSANGGGIDYETFAEAVTDKGWASSVNLSNAAKPHSGLKLIMRPVFAADAI